jgi:hypothetical protein
MLSTGVPPLMTLTLGILELAKRNGGVVTPTTDPFSSERFPYMKKKESNCQTKKIKT